MDWNEDEIFFDDEDMEYEDVLWNTFLWYSEVFNPLAFLDPHRLTTSRGIVQKGTAMGIVGIAMWGAGMMGGGGATALRAQSVSRYSLLKGFAMKADTYRAIASAGADTMGYLARNAIPAFSAAAAVGFMAAATHQWFETVRSLDWVPNYYIGP